MNLVDEMIINEAEKQMGRRVTVEECEKILTKFYEIHGLKNLKPMKEVVEETLFELSSEVKEDEC